jgi:eukaryotic-like serine/threonine-protein kinase
MTAHLSDDQVNRLLSGDLPDTELGLAEDHLWECSVCRGDLQKRTRTASDLPPVSVAKTAGIGDTSTGTVDEPPVIPGYEVLEQLGQGGMGVVWKARQLRPNRIVALKVLRAGLPADADARRRFRSEAEALARLMHPNIVQIFEVGEWRAGSVNAPMPFFSLEFCSGGNLASKLAGAPLPPREAAVLVEAVARAIHHAHRQGIVHRDLKPANILLAFNLDAERGGSRSAGASRLNGLTPKVTDFGLAKSLNDPLLSFSGAVLGTPSYAAPEQVEGTAGPAADIYALGAILYECLAGRPPFKAATVLETLELARTQEPVPLRQSQPGVPRDLETICLKCLEKEPARRYAGADELADDLRRFREGRPVAARPISGSARVRRWARRNPLIAGLAAVLIVTVTVGLGAAFALWANAEWHLRQEETARREAEDNYLTSRELLGEYVAITGDPRLQTPATRKAEREALAKARTFCDGLLMRRPGDAGLRRDLAEVCTGLAAIDAHEGRLADAIEAGETARSLWQGLSNEPLDDSHYRDRLAGVLGTLGRAYARECRTAEADEALRQAIALSEAQTDKGAASATMILTECAARHELASLLTYQGRYEDLSRLYEGNCNRLAKALADGEDVLELRLELLNNLCWLGRQYQHDGNQAGEERCWRRGYDLGRQLSEEAPDSASAVYNLAICSWELTLKDPLATQPEETARLCEQAVRLLAAQRKRDPENRDITHALACVCWSLADSYQQAGKTAEAARAARRTVVVFADLADRQPADLAARLDLLQGQAQLALWEQRWGDASAAQCVARQTAEGFEAFCRARASDSVAAALAGHMSGSLAVILRHAGALSDSLLVAERARRLFEDLIRKEPDQPRHLFGLSECWTQLGKTHWREGHHTETEAALRQAVAAARDLAERWPEYRPLRDERLRRLGRFLEERGRLAEADECVHAQMDAP